MNDKNLTSEEENCLSGDIPLKSKVAQEEDGELIDAASKSYLEAETDDATFDELIGEVEGRENVVKKLPPQKWWKSKLCAHYLSMFIFGYDATITGPTLLDMTLYLGTDIKGLAFAMSLSEIGMLAGVVLTGLVANRIQPELHLALNLTCVGMFIAVAPWGGNLVSYTIFLFLHNIAIGMFNPFAQAYPLHLMGDHRLKNPSVQTIHATWSFGAAVGPLVHQVFLLPEQPSPTLEDSSFSSIENTTATTNSVISTMDALSTGVTTVSSLLPEPTVMYAFLTCGGVVILSSVPSWILYFIAPRTPRMRSKSNESQPTNVLKEKYSLRYHVIMLACFAFWFFLYAFCEVIPAVYMPAFAVKYLGWSKSDGAFTTSLLFISHSIARVAVIPISAFVAPRILFLGSLVITALAFVILLSLHATHPIALWVGIVLAGVGMSSSFGSCYLWLSSHIRLTNRESAVIIVGTSAGIMSANALTGYMFQMYSPLWMLYNMVAAAILGIVVYVVLWLLIRYYKPTQLIT